MYDLKIQNGDFVLHAGGFPEKVSGRSKLEQEMSHILLTPIGSDRYHPRYGSDLGNSIGEMLSEDFLFSVAAEVRETLAELQKQHAAILKDLRLKNRLDLLSPDELLLNVQEVQVYQDYDAVFINIIYQTAANNQLHTLTLGV